MSTLFPKALTLAREGGETLVMTVRQIPLKEYPAALKAANSQDEFELVAVACSTTAGAVQQLTPEAYELLLGEVYIANEKGFFSYARRQKSALVERAMIREMTLEVMSRQMPALASTPPSPTSPPRRG